MEAISIIQLYASFNKAGQNMAYLYSDDYVCSFLRVSGEREGRREEETGFQCLIAGGNQSKVCLICTTHRSNGQNDTHKPCIFAQLNVEKINEILRIENLEI